MHAKRNRDTARVLARSFAFAFTLAACSAPSSSSVVPDSTSSPDSAPDAPPDAPAMVEPLAVQSLGVQGFVLQRGHDIVMTAPLFTRQSEFDVTLNRPITPDTTQIDSHLAGIPMDELRTIVSGHAHYDHLLDVPHVLGLAPGATTLTNLTGRHMLAALAPDRAASCTSAPASPTLDRSRVIAMDDPFDNHVDYTNCPSQIPAGTAGAVTWLQVNPHVRVMGFCSQHPAQVAGVYHFGAGSIDNDLCDVPSAAANWLEGQTLSYVIDFLDDLGHPAFRVYYQDAPTNAPIGQVPPAILNEKVVDLALLCVGNYDVVANQPGDIIANLQPRFAVSGHWEDFFQPIGSALQPLPLLDLNTYEQRADTALPPPSDAPLVVDGEVTDHRHVLAQPGMKLLVPARMIP
jgi:hypothetical protein